MTTKTHVKYRMSVMNGQRNFFQAQFDELKTAEAFGRSCVRMELLINVDNISDLHTDIQIS